MREARIAVRDVYFDIKKGAEHSDVYDFDKVETGTVSGPAIIHKRDGTIPVHPGDVCEIDEYGNCTITIGR